MSTEYPLAILPKIPYSEAKTGGYIMNENRYITKESLIQFHRFLQQEERSTGTIEKYMRDVKNFSAWIKDQSSMSSGFSCCKVTKGTAIRWK